MTENHRPAASVAPADPSDVVELFLQAARRHPERAAIIHNEQELSYARLEGLVRGIAGRLGPDCGTVGVLTERSADTIAAFLGVLAAGGAYCPIDPAFPAERKEALVRAAGCRSVIAPDAAEVPLGLPALRLAEPHPTGLPHAPATPWPAVDPEDPAYVLFTSGSTGAPKPVATPRRAIAAAVDSLAGLLDIAPTDRVLQFASLNWDTCFEEILPALTRGASLVIDDDAYSASFPRFLRMIERRGVTVLDLPTAFWHEFVNHLTEDRAALPGTVRTVVIGGEAARPARLADWRAVSGADRVRLVNTYGCTETTLVTHAIDLHGPLAVGDTAQTATPAAIPIGHALPHVREHIGEDGELLIGGPSLALGYRGLPRITGERFRAFDQPDVRGWYFRTGDRVRREADGALVHEGRLDDELKIRGIRVSPGEAEAQMCGHPDVAAAVATGTVVGDHTALVGYVLPRPHADPATLAAAVLSHLRERSPRHLVPTRITVVPELPHTASGKVDRARTHQLYAIRNEFKEASRAR
ncbi:amino acid adenylation domain-containing protein [Streptomyces netropsis]|uniref:amino acid adenylation domain-containing protein n=1 Tax=Streptomyces netropsis TaxID=55404 RepID=UPI003791DABB